MPGLLEPMNFSRDWKAGEISPEALLAQQQHDFPQHYLPWKATETNPQYWPAGYDQR